MIQILKEIKLWLSINKWYVASAIVVLLVVLYGVNR